MGKLTFSTLVFFGFILFVPLIHSQALENNYPISFNDEDNLEMDGSAHYDDDDDGISDENFDEDEEGDDFEDDDEAFEDDVNYYYDDEYNEFEEDGSGYPRGDYESRDSDGDFEEAYPDPYDEDEREDDEDEEIKDDEVEVLHPSLSAGHGNHDGDGEGIVGGDYDKDGVVYEGEGGMRDKHHQYGGHRSYYSFSILHPAVLALMIGGIILFLLLIVLCVMFVVYRMKKKDEGSYALDENLKKKCKNIIYTKAPLEQEEFFA